jgi:zinc protease
VVQNEKRQGVDNQPYGHNSYVIDKNLYPAGHPYNWQVIGEMEDLFNATVEDVKDFHSRFYGPNNATLVVAGDIDMEETRALVDKYFGEIPGENKVEYMEPILVSLDETKKRYHEDNFAKTPRFTMVWPTVQQYSKDAYALDFLGEILSSGKNPGPGLIIGPVNWLAASGSPSMPTPVSVLQMWRTPYLNPCSCLRKKELLKTTWSG